jgi:hypothetical protein
MAFQFQCPNGHLLEGDESQAGQQCQCPICQTLFIIPQPIADETPEVTPAPPSPEAAPGFPQVGPSGAETSAKQAAPVEIKEPEILHIPCPECKQELETPVEMLDQDVMCPHCQAQFQLRRRDSVEFKRKRKREAEIRERKKDKAWFNFAIFAVVAVLIFIGVLILITVAG